MVGSVGKVETLPEELFITEPLPDEPKRREIVLGRNAHTVCFAIKEPEADDEVTGKREAYMARVLARYRKSLVERTNHFLGYPINLEFDYGALGQLQHFSINNVGDPFIESLL